MPRLPPKRLAPGRVVHARAGLLDRGARAPTPDAVTNMGQCAPRWRGRPGALKCTNVSQRGEVKRKNCRFTGDFSKTSVAQLLLLCVINVSSHVSESFTYDGYEGSKMTAARHSLSTSNPIVPTSAQMKKQLLPLSAVILTCSAQAFAQDPAPPTISEERMTTDSPVSGDVGQAPSDLPAPEDRSWINKPLLITGTALFVASYVPALVISQTSDRPTDRDNLVLPVVGPWMNLADRGCDERACEDENTNKALLIADGVVQGVGALGMLLSLMLPGKTTQNWYLIGDTHVGPMYISNSTYGLGAAGNF